METLNPALLRQRAQERLSGAAYNPKRLVLIHSAAALGLSLFMTAANFILSGQIDNTGGLAGMGLRSILSTIQSTLDIAGKAVLPFWEMGLVLAALLWIRQEPATPGTLLGGFRRFGPVLRLRLLEFIVYFLSGMMLIYFSTTVFVMTPLAQPMVELVNSLVQEGNSAMDISALLTGDHADAIAKTMTPFLVIFGVLFGLLSLYLRYRLRFADFAVMESDIGAMAAMAKSLRVTRGRLFFQIRLDLSFWWFYLLQLFTMVLCYGDMLLPSLGITLPFSQEVSFFLFFLLGIVTQGLLYWHCRGNFIATYALAYKALSQDSMSGFSNKPKNVPWNA